MCKRYPPLPPHYLSLLTMSLHTPAGDQLVVRGGNAHFLPPHKNTIEGDRRKQNRRTNTNKIGVNQEQRKVCNTTYMCIPDSIYGLTLAWVTSENSTMLLESDSSWLTFAGPYPMLPRLSAPVSGVDCPSVDPRQPLCSPLFFQPPTALSGSRRQLPRPGPPSTASLGRVVNSHSRPLTTSGYGEISCPRILCLVSRQNRQLNRLLWQPNHIVLHMSESYFNKMKVSLWSIH